jgi:nucleoside-diphosphate-sugar epimerase
MRIFVAGGTGAIGRALVPQLLQAGHDVSVATRSEARADDLRRIGADAVVCDVLDGTRLRSAMGAAAPEVVVHELTSLPGAIDMRDLSVFDATNELRTTGTQLLLAAALASGASRIVAQSIAFAYEPMGDPIKGEDAPLYLSAAQPFGGAVRAVAELERTVTGTPDIEGVALRYGWLYGPGTYFASDGSTAAAVRNQHYGIIGEGSGIYSFIQVDDAASATVAAVERGAPGIYNVVDDEPAPIRDWLPVYAEVLGAPPPVWVSEVQGEELAGPLVVELAGSMRGASNEKAKRDLAWRPRHANWRQGFATCAG